MAENQDSAVSGDDVLASSYKKFLADREDTKKAQFHAVVRAGFTGITFGLLGVTLIFVAPGHFTASVISTVLNALFVFFATSSLVLLSTLPVKELDLDTFLTKRWIIRSILGIVFTLMGVALISFTLFGAVVALAGVAFLFRTHFDRCCAKSIADKVPTLMGLTSIWLFTVMACKFFFMRT